MKGLFCLLVSIFSFYLTHAKETYHVFEENGLIGLKDANGHVVIPAAYEGLGWSDASFSILNNVTGYKTKGQWGLIDLTNKVVTAALYESLIPAEGNLIVAFKKVDNSRRHRGGCLDTTGKELIPFLYDGINYSSMRAIVFVQSGDQFRYGLIDRSNKILIPLEYRYIKSLGNLRYQVENLQGKSALFTENGKALTAFIFDRFSDFTKDFAVIEQNLRAGLINREGQIITSPIYQHITIGDDQSATGRFQNEWTVLDGLNNPLQKIYADSIVSLNNNLFGVFNNKEVELANNNFSPIVKTRFAFIKPFENNKAIVKQRDKYGMISSNGSMLIECLYHELKKDKHYVLASLQPSQWVLLDSLGNRKTTKTYDHIERFNGIYFAVKSRNYYGAIDANGREIISCVYDSILEYREGKLAVKFHGEYGVIDLQENWLIPPSPHGISLISVDRYLQKQKEIVFLKSFEGDMIYFTTNTLDIEADHLVEYVSTGGIWRIDFDGRIISRQLPPVETYEEIFPETEGLRGIRQNGRFGFIDDRGRLRIANRYEGIKPFQERLAAVKILGKWGFLDHDENLVIQPVHDETTSFSNGIAIVRQKGLYGLINTRGTVVLPVRYQSITPLSTNRFIIETDNQKGLVDTDGRLILSPKYAHITDLNNGYIIVSNNGKTGLVTLQGISTVPMIYDNIVYDRYNARYLALKKGASEKIR